MRGTFILAVFRCLSFIAIYSIAANKGRIANQDNSGRVGVGVGVGVGSGSGVGVGTTTGAAASKWALSVYRPRPLAEARPTV